MSTPYQAKSDDLFASIERMRSRTSLDATARAFEAGEIDTLAAARRPPVNCVLVDRRLPLLRRRPQRSPDKQKSYERRHRLAFAGPLPPHLATRFTVGEMACLRVVGAEHRAKGYCDLSLDEIAARAGVARKTAQRALRHAGPGLNGDSGENLLTIEERRPKGQRKHLPNLVKITSREWLAWLARGAAGAQTKTGHLRPTTVISLVDDDGGGERESSVSEERPQSGLPSKEAVEFATELARIAGHRPNSLPQSWIEADPAQVVQTWINALDDVGVAELRQKPVDLLRRIAVDVRRRKPDPKPPHSPRYFGPTVRMIVDNLTGLRAMVLASHRAVA